jgi:acyl-CoA synthetase (AMP-forming)/AMP-acid ligase II
MESLHQRWSRVGGDRLVEDERRWTLAQLDAAAAKRADTIDGPQLLVAGRASEVLVAMLACEQRGVPLVLVRPDMDAADAAKAARDLPDGFALALPTSGTTGAPKFALHDPARLLGRVRPARPGERPVWLLTFAPATFASVQVILSAMESGVLVSPPYGFNAASAAALALAEGVTHISATPTFWRGFAIQFDAGAGPPIKVATMGGERAGQETLDLVCGRFPHARVTHIFASTETGSLFSVADGREGFPRAWLDTGIDGVSLRVEDDRLWVRSPRAMTGYVGASAITGVNADGWIKTGDLVMLTDDRVLFAGREGRMLNIGGAKVDPEEVEAIINEVPGVADAQVFGRANPVTGTLVAADIVPLSGHDSPTVIASVRAVFDARVAAGFPRHKVPRIVRAVDALQISAAGKKLRGGDTVPANGDAA